MAAVTDRHDRISSSLVRVGLTGKSGEISLVSLSHVSTLIVVSFSLFISDQCDECLASCFCHSDGEFAALLCLCSALLRCVRRFILDMLRLLGQSAFLVLINSCWLIFCRCISLPQMRLGSARREQGEPMKYVLTATLFINRRVRC